MAQNLTEFLLQNPVDNITEQVTLKLKRNGMVFDGTFTIKAVTQDEFSEHQRQTNRIGRHGKTDFDSKRFNELVVLNHTAEPNFKDAAFVKTLGVATPAHAMNKTLLAGEIAELSARIMTLSGFDQDLDEMKDEVKNS